ncbi:hypothetical protein JXJ21_01635 [candidate division KSB1 bacterium]|nr:hypothetical protein [candidate division KSB1 bacterium]
MSINLEILQNYLAYKIPAAERFIFIYDRSNLLTDLVEFYLNDALVPVVHYENDLQLRADLEWAKDDFSGNCFCIISNKSEPENLFIRDFISRSVQVHVTPQDMLNFFGKEHWTDAANWLQGEDFWRCLDTLVRIKDKPNLSFRDQDRAYLASALLNTDFTRRFDAATGFIFYFKKMTSPAYEAFEKNYPQLADFIEEKLFADVPELKLFTGHPRLWQAFWLGQTTDIPQQAFDAEKLYDLKYELAVRVPNFVRDQIEQAESDYFKTASSVDEYLKSSMASDTLDAWITFIRREHLLFEPLKSALKRIIDILIRKFDFIDLKELAKASEELKSHLFYRASEEAATATATFAADIIDQFRYCVQLFMHLCDGKRASSVKKDLLQTFSESLSQLPWLLARIDGTNRRTQFLTPEILQKLARETESVLDLAQSKFAAFIERQYLSVLRGAIAEPVAEQPQYPYHYIKKHLSQSPDTPLYVVIFDGMRQDGWKMLEPRFESLWRNRKREAGLLIAPLPGITGICRPFLLSGQLAPLSPTVDEWEFVKNALSISSLDALTFAENQRDMRRFESFQQAPARLKIMIFDSFDKRIHHSDLPLDQLYLEIQNECQRTIKPMLAAIPADSPILIFADHGFMEPTGKITNLNNFAKSGASSETHRRWIEIKSVDLPCPDLICFSSEALNIADDDRTQFGFLRDRRVFGIKSDEKYTRYAHGGISMEEMIVPMVYLQPMQT